ncbi:MAG: hypothetical protein DI563_01750 [Variovorax paradoxus]|uniref:Glutamine amidotransferase type-2 domain-containing protein n=1 Tax=Variovorax paradoxus TaxID=34073 RepID=A0A2W5S5K5_VARPD|nr:MAG: hypothetical protein DI563_01750 [Variovorax paradoxus]
MCGLVGVAGGITYNLEKVFKNLLQLDTIRGPHSTGVAMVRTNGDNKTVKKLGTPWEGLFDSKDFEEYLKVCSFNVLLGHNRWATKGKINAKNAHPFDFDTLVGAHNGTLRSVRDLDNHEKFEVDSENIYHHMERNGVADTIKLLDGAFALTWYNKEESTINFIRNNERPLYYCLTEDRKAIIWASEDWMIEVACGMAGQKFGEIFSLPIGVHFTFDIPLGSPYQYKPLEKCRTRKLELRQNFQKAVVASTTSTATNNVFKSSESSVGKSVPAAGFMEYQRFVGKSCDFHVDRVATNNYNQKYLQCWACDNDLVSIRCYAGEGSELWMKMINSANFFRAHVKSFSTSEKGYLTIDLRTVEELAEKEEEEPTEQADDTPPEMYVVYGGEVVSRVVYEQRTEKCCSWCSSPVDETDANDLVWLDKHTFVCGSCKEFSEVKQYLKLA